MKFLIFLFVTAMLLCCESESKKTIIAKIDNQEITLDEFRLFYNFDVNFGIDSTGIDALNDELFFYMDQIKAAARAKQDGLINDSIFVRAYNWEKEKAMLRQLYRNEINEKITVTEMELRDLFINQKAKVELKHLFFKQRKNAETAYLQIQQGSTFEEIAKGIFTDDSLASSGGYLGWMNISDLDEELAGSILDLPANVVSVPVKSKWGYHLLKILNKKKNPIISEADFIKSVPSLEKKIKARKSQKLSAEYIRMYLGELNPQLDPQNFKKLWAVIIPKEFQERTKLDYKAELTVDKIQKARVLLKENLSEPLIIYKGGNISFEIFLNELADIPVSHRFVFKTKKELSTQIGKWVRDKILLKKAYKADLENHPRVQRETKRFMEEQSYYYYQSQIADTLGIPDSVRHFYSKSSGLAKKDFPQLARYHTLQEWKFENSKRKLRNYFKNQRSLIVIDKNVLQKENEKIDWDNKIRMFMVRKPS